MSEFLTFFRSEVVGPPEGEAVNSQSQVEALRRVDWLSSALGPKQTRLLLVPLLAQVQREVLDKDELLSLFAVQWRTVAKAAAADTTANDADHQAALSLCAEALAQLADMEEKCIRNEAVESLLYLPSLLPPSSRCTFVRQRLFPLCSSLATSESSLFARCAAARLFPQLVKYAEADRAPISGGPRGAPSEAPLEKRLSAQEPEHMGAAGAPPRAGGSSASLLSDMGGDAAAAAQSSSLKRIIQLYESLCADESFLVRREAIQELPNLIRGAKTAEGVEVSDELALIALRILREAFGETSDFLRAAATGAVVQLATAFPPPKKRLLDVAIPRQQVVASPQNGGSETSMPVEGESEKKGIFSVGEALSLHLLGASDPSWRVRSVAAKEMISAIKFAPLNYSDFHPSLCLLLKDFALRDVRLEAVRCVAQAARVLPGEEVTTHLAPLVKQLLSDFVSPNKPADPWVDVGTTAAFPGGQNAAFAAAVDAALAVAQNAEATAAKAIVKELITTLQEGDLFAAMCITKRVPDFCSLCQSRISSGNISFNSKNNVEQEAAALVQAICELRQQTGLTADWRLRLEIVKQMPAIANALGGSFFRTWLSSIYLEAFSDPICEVREAAVGACKELVCSVGTRWAVDTLLPRLLACYEGSIGLKNENAKNENAKNENANISHAETTNNSSYLQRIVVQHALPKLTGVLPRDVVAAQLVPLLIKALHDPVCNVRLTAAEMLRIIADEQTLLPTTFTELIPHLEALSSDDDVDVRFSSSLALDACRVAAAGGGQRRG